MLFTHPFFLFCFLPAVLGSYYLAPRKARNAVLSLASLIFYASGEWGFVGWLVASVAVNYWIGRGIQLTRGRPWAKWLLAIGLTSDLALLIVFKYGGFLVGNLDLLLGALHAWRLPVPHLLLPLGISFFTFHKITYKVDVYRGVAEAKRKPFDLALYILFFPQLIAGPIVRYHEIAAELERRCYRREDFAEGVRRFITGFGRKMIVANPAGYCADRIFALSAHDLTTSLAWLGLVCYAVQIYFDFAGYSDMAIGLARIFGFHFPENFNYPYLATSVTEFWRRWHMSLSRFFRDYLYIPLGGNRISPARTYGNLVVVFFLCGLWHGASWTFVIWGMTHGALLMIERAGCGRVLARLPRPVRHAYALLAVGLAWVFFRADTFTHAISYFAALFGHAGGQGVRYYPALYLDHELLFALAVGIIGSTSVVGRVRQAVERLSTAPGAAPGAAARVSLALAEVTVFPIILGYSLMLAAAGTYNPFIYFRF